MWIVRHRLVWAEARICFGAWLQNIDMNATPGRWSGFMIRDRHFHLVHRYFSRDLVTVTYHWSALMLSPVAFHSDRGVRELLQCAFCRHIPSPTSNVLCEQASLHSSGTCATVIAKRTGCSGEHALYATKNQLRSIRGPAAPVARTRVDRFLAQSEA